MAQKRGAAHRGGKAGGGHEEPKRERRHDPALAERLRQALREFNARHRTDLTMSEIGRRLAGTVGGEPLSVARVSYLFNGQEPRATLALALAFVLEADPFALYLPNAARAAATGGQPQAAGPDLTRERVVHHRAAAPKGKRAG